MPKTLPTFWRAWWPPAVVAVTFVGLAAWSWRGWPDLLVDFGHELYLPWRLTAGEALYRDLASALGPVAPHFNALVFRVFGVR